MTPLTFWLFCISTLDTYRRSSSHEDALKGLTPREVRFHSLDYSNVLHWKPQSSTRQGQKFLVQYKVPGITFRKGDLNESIQMCEWEGSCWVNTGHVVNGIPCTGLSYGDKQWTNVTQCLGISQTSCDLSQQTSNPREWYYARVQAALPDTRSGWALSPRFNPYWETSVSPPTMKLNATEQGVVVQLRPPRSPYRRRQGSFISMRKLQKLTFRISITHDEVLQETHEVEGCVTELLVKDLDPRTIYCFQVQTHLLRQGRSGTRSDPMCITTL